MDYNFFNKFISYSIKKKYLSIFQNGLTYIKEVETFIKVIESNKLDIFDYYNKVINENNMIKIDKYLQLKKDESKKTEKDTEKEDTNANIINEGENTIISSESAKEKKNEKRKIIPEFIDNLESIINFSKEKKKVFINLTNDFWRYILNCYNEITTNNIKICSKLRGIIVEYSKLVVVDDSLNNSKLKKEVL